MIIIIFVLLYVENCCGFVTAEVVVAAFFYNVWQEIYIYHTREKQLIVNSECQLMFGVNLLFVSIVSCYYLFFTRVNINIIYVHEKHE